MTRGRVRRNGEGRGKSDLPHEAFLNCSKSLWIIENLRLSKISVIKVINKIWKKNISSHARFIALDFGPLIHRENEASVRSLRLLNIAARNTKIDFNYLFGSI